MRFLCSALPIFALAFVHSSVLAQTSTYKNPVDGKEYTADWAAFEPETPKSDLDARVAIENVVLLTSQDDLANRIDVQSLTTYIENLETDLLELAVDSSDSGKVWLQVDMEPKQSPVHQPAYDGPISTDLLHAYYEKISKDMDVPAVLGAVSFQLLMAVRDHSNLQGDKNPE
jgi:hypothetical protein